MDSGILQNAAVIIDLFSMAFVLGATAWFFFIQSPLLHTMLVREKFVPIQIRLSRRLFTSLFVALIVNAVAAGVQTASLVSPVTLTAAFALLIGTLTRFLIFPKALRAGGESMKLQQAHGETGGATEFLVDGAGRAATRMHRVVVVFVLLMVLGLVAHGVLMIL